ncbi:hypothetical protein P280DRAFT_543199 [Massarina eburnea CBS 473.64]|uniref:Uncharacterized protein n=1 Tax=Massarina eburnea CBS 473.64 TaxID=1395130 RepID=A0A6A6RZF1_9PLEO|nr:hypothetical protein P280DRAFT_543199 [Massarina eburnea CBS 473.64]
MSGIEAAGVVLGILPFMASARESEARISTQIARFRAHIARNGIVMTFYLHILFPDALFVMERVERYVLTASDQEVVAFMKSYNSSFNMIGVAGAIIAQVAISALSLTNLESSHWTGTAFFITSLVTGALSVFFSCAVSPAFHGLHSAEDIKDFLTKPTPSNKDVEEADGDNPSLSFRQIASISPSMSAARSVQLRHHFAATELQKWKAASPHAAVMLVVPMTLLKVALNTFLIGLGIYLGKLCTAKIIPSYGTGSVGILVFYIVSTLSGIAMYYVAQNYKYLERARLERWHKQKDDLGLNEVVPRPVNPDVMASSGHQPDLNSREQHRTGKSAVEHDDAAVLEEIYSPMDEQGQQSITASRQSDPAHNNDLSTKDGSTNTIGLNGDVRHLLKELLDSQEESLRINKRLLEALSRE